MPKARRRLTIDVSELAERIENCRDDLAWQNLSLSAKIRVLIETALTQVALPSSEQRLADSAVSSRELELARKWVSGDRLENGELGIVANLLGVEPEELVKKQRKFAPKQREAEPC